MRRARGVLGTAWVAAPAPRWRVTRRSRPSPSGDATLTADVVSVDAASEWKQAQAEMRAKAAFEDEEAGVGEGAAPRAWGRRRAAVPLCHTASSCSPAGKEGDGDDDDLLALMDEASGM